MMVSSSMGAEEGCGDSTVSVAVLVLDMLTVIDVIDVEKKNNVFDAIQFISSHINSSTGVKTHSRRYD